MRFDVIVFSQEELDNAVNAGYKHIALCDGCFVLPDNDEISYVHIGQVYTGQACGGEAAAVCDLGQAYILPALPVMPSSAMRYPSSNSFGGSMSGSYAYLYEYAYRLASSFGSSFISSFASMYSSLYWSLYGSFQGLGSFAFGSYTFGSYTLGSLFFGSFSLGSFSFGSFPFGSFPQSYNASLYPFDGFEELEGYCPVVYVNGYGINLI